MQSRRFESEFSVYRVLGGWLKAIVICAYIAAGLLVVSSIITVATLVSIGNMFSSVGASGLLGGIGFVSVAIYLIMAAIMFVLAGKIRKKDPTFLRFIHVTNLILIILSFIGNAITTGVASAFGNAISTALGVFVETLYFCKSVRVNVYMGSDEYIRLSPFTRNVQSPLSRMGYSNQAYTKPTTASKYEASRRDTYDNNSRSSASSRPRDRQQGFPQLMQTNRCCICRHELWNGYAVLFKNTDGSEGRICEECCNNIGILAKSNDKNEVLDALDYFDGITSVRPNVARHLNRFINMGEEFIHN